MPQRVSALMSVGMPTLMSTVMSSSDAPGGADRCRPRFQRAAQGAVPTVGYCIPRRLPSPGNPPYLSPIQGVFEVD